MLCFKGLYAYKAYMSTSNVIGAEIEARRVRAKLTQTDLAERVGILQSSVSKYESGRQVPRWPLMERIAEALGCEPADLVKRSRRRPRAA